MRRLLTPAIAMGLALSAVAAAPAQDRSADVDHEVTVEIDSIVTVDGGVPQGVNPGYNEGVTGCSKDPHAYCETMLVQLVNEYDEDKAKKGRERANAVFTLTTGTNQVSDYDVFWYESDADGTKGAQIGSSTAFPYGESSTEGATIVTTTTPEVGEVWVYVEVVYFTAFEAWSMEIDFAN
ncbi:MAG: hypothetical protein HKN46_01235 [Acidimicrobiia bacterium]|nr:hypothetical protein [Acidimicrobiia bacterium]